MRWKLKICRLLMSVIGIKQGRYDDNKVLLIEASQNETLMTDKRQNEVIVDSIFGRASQPDFRLLHSNLS